MKKSIKNDILKYVRENYADEPDYPWSKDNESAVLRHKNNLKWYALITTIPKLRLGQNVGDVDIINLKCEPLMIGGLLSNDGYFPAYHMNKEHWITVLLDGSVPHNEIYNLIDISFELTK